MTTENGSLSQKTTADTWQINGKGNETQWLLGALKTTADNSRKEVM